jgi:hypothetical protein
MRGRKLMNSNWFKLVMKATKVNYGKNLLLKGTPVIYNKRGARLRELFVEQIEQWFGDVVKKDTPKLDAFCEAFPAGDAATIENLLNDYLWNTISIRDTAVAKPRKENFYHGILLGLLRHKEKWLVMSNAQSGEGYSDILIEVPESKTGVVIELKYAEGDKLEEACAEALDQIDEKQYDAQLKSDGMQTIMKYGIACFRKHCRVVVDLLTLSELD